MDLNRSRFLARGLAGPEAVAWDPRGYLYAGTQDGFLHRIDPGIGVRDVVAQLGGKLLGILVDEEGSILVCNQDAACVQRVSPSDGVVSTVTSGSPEALLSTPNYLAQDSRGILYVSDSGDWDAQDGRIFAHLPSGETLLLETASFAYPNGLAIDPIEQLLIVVESSLPGVVSYPLETLLTSPKRSERWLAPPDSIPDGIVRCADGSVLVTFYQPNMVLHLREWVLEDLIRDDAGILLRSPTNGAFFGANLDRLVLANLEGDHLLEVRTHLVGAALVAPRESS